MTLGEFLVWPGDGTAKRYELVDGVVRAMSPQRRRTVSFREI